VRSLAATSNDRPALRGALHLASHVFPDFKCPDANVGADRHDELGRVVRKRIDGARHDPGNRTTPTGMHCANVPARRMRDQHRHTVSRARSNADPFDPRDQHIAFLIRHHLGTIGRGQFEYLSPVHLALLKQSIAAKPEALGESGAILVNCCVIIAQMETQVERVERHPAHPAQTRRKPVAEAVPIQ